MKSLTSANTQATKVRRKRGIKDNVESVIKCSTARMKIAQLENRHVIHAIRLDIGEECVGAGKQ